MSTYFELARKLPVPTEEQTHGFAEYVTSAHSWYKHLRIQPPVPFVFYLDPNSGRDMVHVSDDELAFVDTVNEKEAFHYTWQTTESYRRCFGYWNYHAPFGTSFHYQTEAGVVDTAGTGLMIFFEESGWVEVPERLVLAGTALVSALMYATYGPKDAGPPGFEVESSFLRPPHATRGELVRYNEPSSVFPEEIANAARKLEALWDSEDYRREKIETYRALSDQFAMVSAKAEANNCTWDEVQDPAIRHAMFAKTEDAWARTESRCKERALMAPVTEAISRERQRQISGMVAAMNQFIKILHKES